MTQVFRTKVFRIHPACTRQRRRKRSKLSSGLRGTARSEGVVRGICPWNDRM